MKSSNRATTSKSGSSASKPTSSVLDYDTRMGGYVVDLTREQLEGAPTFARNETPNYDDPAWGRKVHDYYGVTPWWPTPIH